MNIAIIGGRGYVGSAVTETVAESHDVTTIDPGEGGDDHIRVSILADDLAGHLDAFDAVINLVGLSPLQKPRGITYEQLHVDGPKNVVKACQEAGIDRLVHMSALGADADSDIAFLRTKGEGEAVVTNSGLDVTILRPSMIFDHGNELIEQAKLLSHTRTFPHIRTKVQPIYRSDVAHLFALAVDGDIDEEICEIAGEDVMSIFRFVKYVYGALGRSCIPLPLETAMKLSLPVLEVIPFSPVGTDQAKFLDVDNVTDDNVAPAYLDTVQSYPEWVKNAF